MLLRDRLIQFVGQHELFANALKVCGKVFIVLLIATFGWIGLKFLFSRLESFLRKNDEQEGAPPSEAERRRETIMGLVRTTANIVFFLVVALSVLNEVGISLGPVLASAGVASVAVGFGAQNLVKDFIAGFFIILENQIRVGDFASLNGTEGTVESLRFRTTLLRDSAGVLHVFQNGNINALSNFTKGWSAFVPEIAVAYKEDIDQVFVIIREVFQQLKSNSKLAPFLLENDIEIFGISKFADSSVNIGCRIKTLPLKQWEVGREFNMLLKKKFEANKVEMPFPHMSFYFGENSKPIRLLSQNLDL